MVEGDGDGDEEYAEASQNYHEASAQSMMWGGSYVMYVISLFVNTSSISSTFTSSSSWSPDSQEQETPFYASAPAGALFGNCTAGYPRM